jgi:hypothetical protein
MRGLVSQFNPRVRRGVRRAARAGVVATVVAVPVVGSVVRKVTAGVPDPDDVAEFGAGWTRRAGARLTSGERPVVEEGWGRLAKLRTRWEP